jgi:ribokinase
MSCLVTVVGSLNIDTVVGVERHPRPGETVLGLELVDRPGGKGANQALAVRRAGARALLIGRVGMDEDGRMYREALSARGVDVHHVHRTPKFESGRAIVCVDGRAENSIVVIPGANTALSRQDVLAAEASIAASALLLLQLESPAEVVELALQLARKHGVFSVLNASPVTPTAEKLASQADLVIVNEHERAQLPNIKNACVTLGAKGASWLSHTRRPLPALVVDTTGAGDAFAGTLAGYLALGWDPADALQKAVEAGTEATTWPGAQPWVFEATNELRADGIR